MSASLSRITAPLLLAALAAATLAASPVAGSASRRPPPPPKTDAGSYQGSWFYTDRVANMAIWLDEGKKGSLSMRYRYRVKAGGHGDSGETGIGSTISEVGPGTIRLTHRKDSDGVLRGALSSSWLTPDGEGSERYEFEAWRTAPGDHLYFLLKNGKRELRRGEETTVEPLDDVGFMFVKATDELIFWEEFPF